jgi:hypothetical protein
MTDQLLFHNWGTRNLAKTYIDGWQAAKKMADAVTAAGLNQPGPRGGGYLLSVQQDGKYAVVSWVQPSGKINHFTPQNPAL